MTDIFGGNVGDNITVRLRLSGRREFSADAERAEQDVRRLGRTVRETDRQARRAGRGLGIMASSVRTLGTWAVRAAGTAGIIGLTAAVGTATGAFVTMGIRSVAAFEQAEIAFDTMLPAGIEAKQFLEGLEEFAARTPFDFPGLTTASQRLLAYGFAAQDLLPMLERVGDASAALGMGQEGIDRTIRALGQMRARGKVAAQEMLQLTEVGVPAWQYLADAIGTSIGGAMEAVERRQVDAVTGIRAIMTGMERDFGGLMERQSTTIQGRWSTLVDTIRSASRRAFEPFTDEMGGALEWATGAMEDFGGWFARTAPTVINSLIDNVPQALEGFATGNAGMVGDAISDMLGGSDAIEGIVTIFAQAGMDIYTILTDLVLPVVGDLAEGAEFLIGPLRIAGGILSFVADNAEPLQPILAGVLTAFLAFKGIMGVLAMIKAGIAGVSTALAFLAANPVVAVIAGVAGLVVGIKYAYEHFEGFRNVVDTVWQALQVGWDWILKIGEGFLRWGHPLGAAVTILQRLGVGFDDVVNAGAFMVETLARIFLLPFEVLVRAWNMLDFEIDLRVPGWVPGIGGRGFHVEDLFPDIPIPRIEIPRLHTGGTVVRPGMVNIRPDEELVYLPPSAVVAPLDDELGGAPDLSHLLERIEIVVPVNLDRRQIAEATVDGMRDLVAGRR